MGEINKRYILPLLRDHHKDNKWIVDSNSIDTAVELWDPLYSSQPNFGNRETQVQATGPTGVL